MCTTGKIRWGIIGCGDVTEKKSGPGFQKAGNSTLLAVMRRDAAKAEDYANRHGVPRWYDDMQALVADPEVDAVYIATPPGAHTEAALAVAQAGKPVYIEKPLTRNATEGRMIFDAFAGKSIPAFAAYYRRMLPRFVQVKQWLDEGRIGEVLEIQLKHESPPAALSPGEIPWRLDATASGGGLFLDLGSHALDLLDHLLGPLQLTSSVAKRQAACGSLPPSVCCEDFVDMHFTTTAGARGQACWNFYGSSHEDNVEIRGTLGTISFPVFAERPIQCDVDGRTQSLTIPHPEHVQQPLIQSIVDELLGRGHSVSTVESALRTTQLMDDVLSDYYGGRNDAFWERPETWPGAGR